MVMNSIFIVVTTIMLVIITLQSYLYQLQKNYTIIYDIFKYMI